MATIERHVTRELVALDGGTPCSEAARRMMEENIGSIAVREGERIVGLVSERDLVSTLVAGGAPADLPIRDAMRRDLPTVSAMSAETACVALMRDHVCRHLLVEEEGAIVGIISMRDLIRLMLDEKEWMIGQLQTFIEGRDGPRATA